MRHRKTTLACLIVLVLAVTCCVALDAGRRTPAGAELTGEAASIKAALEAYGEAITQKDIDKCMSMYVDDPKTVMLGTGPGERWLGLDAIRDAHLRFFDSFDSEESKTTWRVAQMDGNVAWGASMRVVNDYYKNIKREFYLNISAVLVKKDGRWQISMFHFSNLTGPDES